MVQLEEVPDQELHQPQPGPDVKDEEDDWDTDDGMRSSLTPDNMLNDKSA